MASDSDYTRAGNLDGRMPSVRASVTRRQLLKRGAAVGALALGAYAAPTFSTATAKRAYAGITSGTPLLPEASITPASGPPGSTFTITDSGLRVQPGDTGWFYLPGEPLSTWVAATSVAIAGGSSLSAPVPAVSEGFDYYIAVRPASNVNHPSRFNDLPFTVA